MSPSSSVVRFLGLTFDRTTGELCRDNEKVRLSGKPFLALNLLIEKSNRLVSREELCTKLWPAGTFVDFDDNLNATIKRLREALGDPTEMPRMIETVPRLGYRFIATIEEYPPRTPASEPLPTIEPAPTNEPPSLIKGMSWQRIPRAAAVCTGALVAAVLVSMMATRTAKRAAETPTPRITRLAIVQFSNFTGHVGSDFLSDGLWTEVATRLRRLAPKEVAVIMYEAPNGLLSSSSHQPASKPDVDYILEGELKERDGVTWLTTQFIAVRTSTLMWSADFQLPLQEVFVQHELAERVTRTLSLRPPPESRSQLSREFTMNTAAHQAYLQGREALSRKNDTSARSALNWFRAASTKDPQYAPPYAGLAQAYLRLGKSHLLPLPQGETEAARAITTGEALDPAIASFALLKAMMLSNQIGSDRQAEIAYLRAIELDPTDAMAHAQYALFLRERRPKDGLTEINKALSLNPLSPWINAYAGALLMANGYADKADSQLRKALTLDGDTPVALRFMGDLEEKCGRPDKAMLWYERAASASGRDPFYLYRLGLAYARSGKSRETLTILRELRNRAKTAFVEPFYITDLQSAMAH